MKKIYIDYDFIDSELLRKDHYRSILKILMEYQTHKGGLKAKHFRYALCPNHDAKTEEDNPEGLHHWTLNEMEIFFGEQLEKYYYSNEIKKGCVTSRKNLDNFLKRLIKNQIIKKPNNEKQKKRVKRIYKINDIYMKLLLRRENEKTNNFYPINTTRSILVHDDFANDYYSFNHLIHGISPNVWKSFSVEEKRKLKSHVDNIEEEILAIEKMREEKTYARLKERIIPITKSLGNEKFTELIIERIPFFVILAGHYGNIINIESDQNLNEIIISKFLKPLKQKFPEISKVKRDELLHNIFQIIEEEEALYDFLPISYSRFHNNIKSTDILESQLVVLPKRDSYIKKNYKKKMAEKHSSLLYDTTKQPN